MLPAAGRAPLGLACPSLASASVDVVLEGHSEHEWSGDSQLLRTLHPTCSAHSGLSYAWPSAWPTGWRGGGEAARPQAGPSLMAEAGQGWGERAVGWPPESRTSVPPRLQKLSPGVRRAGGRSACPRCLPGTGFLDWVPKKMQRVGCVELLNTVQRRVQPRLHVFGHIHEGQCVGLGRRPSTPRAPHGPPEGPPCPPAAQSPPP